MLVWRVLFGEKTNAFQHTSRGKGGLEAPGEGKAGMKRQEKIRQRRNIRIRKKTFKKSSSRLNIAKLWAGLFWEGSGSSTPKRTTETSRK